MVSVFPPSYGLVAIFNISENSILEIIEHGYSESFHKKVKMLIERYDNSMGLDDDKIPFIRNLKKRCVQLNKEEGYEKYKYDLELEKILIFLKEYLASPKTYFTDYVNVGRKLRKKDKAAYRSHKLKCVSYTPFGSFLDRRNLSFRKPSGYLYFDIDEKLTASEKKKLITFFIEDQYVKASWLSFSKEGFGFIAKAAWSNEKEMKKIYYKLVEYFTLCLKAVGINKRLLDTQVCSLSRMNFLSNGMIKNKTAFKEFRISDYSDELFSKIHDVYKKNSKKPIPDKPFTENDVRHLKNRFKDVNKVAIDEDLHLDFIKNITKNISFMGSDDYNSSIKDYISIIFRYDVDENIVEQHLFDNIPETQKTQKTFNRMWKSFSSYSAFKTVTPCSYN